MKYREYRSLEGLSGHDVLRQRAVNNYYENPKLCEYCRNPLKVKVNEFPSRTRTKKFCNHSCAAKFNNPLRIGKITRQECRRDGCTELVKNYRTTLCRVHHKESKKEAAKTMTIGEYRKRQSVKGKHPSWKHAGVYGLNRSWNKDLRKLPCKKCGYSYHVDLCHIKPLASYPDSALLRDINSRENNVQLCKNCHWEFDRGLFKIGDIV